MFLSHKWEWIATWCVLSLDIREIAEREGESSIPLYHGGSRIEVIFEKYLASLYKLSDEEYSREY